MPAGLQVFDASGRVIFDTNYRVSRFLGIVSPPLGTTTYTHSGLVNGTPFAFYVFEGDAIGPTLTYPTPQMTAPQFSFSGTTMTITRGAPQFGELAGTYTVYYGVY